MELVKIELIEFLEHNNIRLSKTGFQTLLDMVMTDVLEEHREYFLDSQLCIFDSAHSALDWFYDEYNYRVPISHLFDEKVYEEDELKTLGEILLQSKENAMHIENDIWITWWL
jgi:hypothetical protein